MKLPWHRKIRAEHLPEEFAGLVPELGSVIHKRGKETQEEYEARIEEIGTKLTVVVMQYFEGCEPYYPKFNGTFYQQTRIKLMKERFNELKAQGKKGIAQIVAKEYGITDRRARDIVHDVVKNHEDQTELFGSD